MDAEFAKDDRKRSRTAKSCGPDAPMAGVKFLGSSRFLGMTVTNKLWSHRGEHEISCKTIAQEGRSVSAEPVCSCVPSTCILAHETAGAACTRSSLRPLSFGANEFAKLGRNVSREGGVSRSRRPGLATGPTLCPIVSAVEWTPFDIADAGCYGSPRSQGRQRWAEHRHAVLKTKTFSSSGRSSAARLCLSADARAGLPRWARCPSPGGRAG